MVPQVTDQLVQVHEDSENVSVDNKETLLDPEIEQPVGGGGCAFARLTLNKVSVRRKNWLNPAEKYFFITNGLCNSSYLLFYRFTDGMVLNRLDDIMVLVEHYL